MTVASIQARAAGGYNNYGVDYLTPKTGGQTIQIAASADGSDPYVGFNGGAGSVDIDIVGEFTPGSGVTIDSVLLKDGGVRLLNNINLTARNNANNADLNLLKLSTSDKLLFNASVIDDATRASLSAAKTGANSDITSLTACPTVTGDGGAIFGSNTTYCQFKADGVVSWVIGDSLAVLRTTVDNTGYVGSALYRVKEVNAVTCKATNFYPATRQTYTVVSSQPMSRTLDCTSLAAAGASYNQVAQQAIIDRIHGMLGYMRQKQADDQAVGIIQ